MAILGEALGDVDPHALLDIVQDLLIAALVADEQQPQAVVAQHLQCVARHVRLGIARPGDAEFAQPARDLLARGRSSVNVSSSKKNSLHLREGLLGTADFLDHVLHAARAVLVPADRLRPETKCAARFAAAARIERYVRVLEIADEILVDVEVALVDRRDERQVVHVGQRRSRLRLLNDAVLVAIAEAGDVGERLAFGDLAHREIVVLRRDEIDRVRLLQALARRDRDIGADKADLDRRDWRPSARARRRCRT